MIISFAWTIPALLAGRKRRTRRNWSDDYARKFIVGSTHQAYERLPRVHGSKVGLVLLSRDPFKQSTCLMTEEDYEFEGLKYMEENDLFIPVRTVQGKRLPAMHPRAFFDAWRESDQNLWVINFEFIPIK